MILSEKIRSFMDPRASLNPNRSDLAIWVGAAEALEANTLTPEEASSLLGGTPTNRHVIEAQRQARVKLRRIADQGGRA